MTQQLFPMALVRYATERGYPGMPTVGAVKFDGHDWEASSFYGKPCAVDVVSQLARAGAEWVCVHWRDAGISGISADFQLSELTPMTGLRACGIDRPAPICAHCGKPGAISEAHLDPSGESRCRACLLASYGSAMRETAETEPEILDDVHNSYAECGTPVNSSNLAGWRDHSRLCALRSVYEGAGIMAENGETVDAYVSLENAVGAYLRGADAPSIISAGFVS